jgi:hypothetical protein
VCHYECQNLVPKTQHLKQSFYIIFTGQAG